MTGTSNFGLPIYGNTDVPKWTDTNEPFQNLDGKVADKTANNTFTGTNTFDGQVTHNASLMMKTGSIIESDDGVITPTAPSSDKVGTGVMRINDSAGNQLYRIRPIQHSNGKVDFDIASQPSANGGTLTFNGADVINQSSSDDYSTQERVVGTWVDGRPIYEKTYVDSTTRTLNPRTQTMIEMETDTTKQLLFADFGVHATDSYAGWCIMPTTPIDQSSGNAYFTAYANQSIAGVIRLVFNWADGGAYHVNFIWCTYRYIKSTDTPTN